MTQKELLYVEDAISHEKIIIDCINSIIKNLNDKELIKYMNSDLENHEKINKKLMTLLENNND